MSNLEQKRVGKYTIFSNRKLTELKFASIYAGIETETKKRVLIKAIDRKQYETNPVLMNSLNFELNSMQALKSDKILRITDVQMTKNNIYLILEEPKGFSFKALIKSKGPQQETQIRDYLRKISKIFEELRSSNIIHGNINSRSVLVHHGQVKLSYPSYVKTIEVISKNTSMPSETDSSETEESKTPKKDDYSYLPPELLAAGMITQKHDIWSLGVVIYESLMGKLPWDVSQIQNPLEAASVIINNPLNFECENGRLLSKEMQHFIAGCLKIDPSERFDWGDVLEHGILKNNVFIVLGNESTASNNEANGHGLAETKLRKRSTQTSIEA